MTQAEYKSFYLQHLKETILPFWLNRAIDDERGGVFTCFDNADGTLLSTDKYVWSQGRAAWLFAALSEMDEFTAGERARFLEIAGNTASFIAKHAFLENGNAAFLLTREGAMKEPVPGGGYDTSVYVDNFVSLGFSRYARASGDTRFAELADRSFASMLRRVGSGRYASAPYPVPGGYRSHGPSMIATHNARELGWTEQAKASMNEVLGRFCDGKHIREYVPADGGFDDGTLLGRYINPGHILECMWFLLDAARDCGDKEAIAKIMDIILNALETGWDREHGGLLLYCDKDGGSPRGSLPNPEEPMGRKVAEDWGCKLWWVHSEALYTTLYAYKVSGDARFLEWHEKLHDYTFDTFPNPDKTVGEWINVRTRDGTPDPRVVALPVKDPYHIARNLLLLAQL
jgi:N-acylglucosamine 2-epimerase